MKTNEYVYMKGLYPWVNVDRLYVSSRDKGRVLL